MNAIRKPVLGCEVFVVDAGWYGAGDGDWGAQTGDWRERPKDAFCARMGEFADEVRAAGLGFDLWMEPERFGSQAPLRAKHPEWFIPVGTEARLDLTKPPAWRWLRGEIARLVETYRLGNAGVSPLLRPMGLKPSRRYRLRWGFGATAKDSSVVDGATLARDGLRLQESGVWQEQAAVCVIRPARA